MPKKILSRFEIGWIYGWDSEIETIYQSQFEDKENNNEKEKDTD